jgi:hypothetical protein
VVAGDEDRAAGPGAPPMVGDGTRDDPRVRNASHDQQAA